jgi:hypothetical protein
MESETQQETFGSYLQDFRIKRELAIDTVAEQTKIAVHCLKAIETDNHADLPPPAYVRSFLRAYAKAVGANPDLAVSIYMDSLKREEQARQKLRKHEAKVWMLRRTLITAGVIVGMLLFLRYTDILLDLIPPYGDAPAETPKLQPAPAAEPEISVKPDLKTAKTERLKLRVLAVEQTWLKVIVDGENAKSYTLKPAEQLELEGGRDFNLMIGNATGLKIFLDDQPVKIYGGKDQVVSLKIP